LFRKNAPAVGHATAAFGFLAANYIGGHGAGLKSKPFSAASTRVSSASSMREVSRQRSLTPGEGGTMFGHEGLQDVNEAG